MATTRVMLDIIVDGKHVMSIPRSHTAVFKMDSGLSVFLSTVGALVRLSGPNLREVVEAIEAGDNLELKKAGEFCVVQVMTNKDIWNEGSDSSLRKIFMVPPDAGLSPADDLRLTPPL